MFKSVCLHEHLLCFYYHWHFCILNHIITWNCNHEAGLDVLLDDKSGYFFFIFHGFRKQSSSFSISCWLFTSRVYDIFRRPNHQRVRLLWWSKLRPQLWMTWSYQKLKLWMSEWENGRRKMKNTFVGERSFDREKLVGHLFLKHRLIQLICGKLIDRHQIIRQIEQSTRCTQLSVGF